MSSIEQPTSSNFQLIVDALADYAEQTGIDLSNNPFARRLELSNSSQAIVELLEERERAFKEYRDRNQRLISCISPAVGVLYAFSATFGEVIGSVNNTCHLIFLSYLRQVPFPPTSAIFVGIDVLLGVCPPNALTTFTCDV